MYAESRAGRTAWHADDVPDPLARPSSSSSSSSPSAVAVAVAVADAPLTRLALIFAHDEPSPAHPDTGAQPVSLRRQSVHYLLIGGLQWLLDWGVTVWLSHLGMLIE